jgi:hypothetical protein
MSMNEIEIKDFLTKTEAYLTVLDASTRQAQLQEWEQTLRRYAEANPDSDSLRIKRLLGGPRGLANVILLRQGQPLKGTKASSTRQVLTWFVLGGAGLFLLLAAFLWWKFTPLIDVREDRVQMLGGLIDIDGQLGQVKFGDSFEYSDSQYKNLFEGSYEIPTEEVEDLILEFDRGQMELTYTDDNRLSWNCKVTTEPSEGFIRQQKEAVVVSFKHLGGADCSFKLPTRLKHTINGDAGKVDLIAPANDTFVQLGSGLVTVSPDAEATYRFDLRVGQGQVDPALEKLSKEGGIEIKIDVGTGRVQKN